MKKNYGWIICAVCALVLFCNAGLGHTGFSVYQPYLLSIGGLTNTQSSMVIMCRTIFAIIGMLCVEKLIARFEVRIVMSAALVVCAAGFLIFSLSSTLFAGYCFGSALTGLATGIGGMISVSIIITRWFRAHSGLAIGICMAATGLSSVVASPVATNLIENRSLRFSFTIESAFIFLIAIIAFVLLRNSPESAGMEPVVGNKKDKKNSKNVGFASHPMPKNLYYVMALGILLFGIPANISGTHLGVLYSTQGFSTHQISVLVAQFGAFLAIGKCTYGFISDKIGTFKASLLMYIFTALGSVLLCISANGPFAFIIAEMGAIMVGFGMAVTTVSSSIYAMQISTKEQYVRVLSRFQLYSLLGSVFFGPVPGMIADRTGSYIPCFWILFLLVIVSSSMLLISYRKIIRRDNALTEADNEEASIENNVQVSE